MRWPPWSRLSPSTVSPGFEQRLVTRHVGVGAGVRLDVGVLGAEQRLGALDGEVLDVVDDRVAAVVALARVALGVLVGEHRAGGAQHRRRGEVLAGDQLQAGGLAFELEREQPVDLEVGIGVGGERHDRATTVPRGDGAVRSELLFELGDLGDPAGVAPALEVGGEEERDDLLGESDADDPGPDRQHVGVVVVRAPGGPCRGQLQSAARTPLTLLAASCSPWPDAADHDAELGFAVANGAPDGGADAG